MIDTEIVLEELEWIESRYEKSKKNVEAGNVADDALPTVYDGLGRKSRSIAICSLLLDESDINQWLKFSVQYFIESIDKADEYEELLEDSYRVNRPTYCKDALHAAVLAGETEYVEQAFDRTFAIDYEWIRTEAPEREHVLDYAVALASYLDGDEATAQEWLDDLDTLDHGFERFDALGTALAGILHRDEAELTAGVEGLLQAHHDKFGPSPDTATGFLSVDAIVYLVLAERAGLEIDREQIDDALLQYVPDSVPV